MRIVHIVPERPSSNGSGAQLRSHALSLALSRQGVLVTLDMSEVFRAAGIRPIRAASFIEVDVPARVLQVIETRAGLAPGDIAVVEGVYLSQVAYRLAATGARVIVDAHNVESNLLRQNDLARHPFLARLQRRGRWRRAVEAERKLLQSVAAVWACSQADAALLGTLAGKGATVHVVPNPMPDWCLSEEPLARLDGIDALLVGHLGYRPNIAAALRLTRRILPALQATYPSASLTLAGRAPSPALRRAVAGCPWVRLLPDPDDLAPIYRSATMALMPLAEGGGTRIKVLEAMALGLPVVGSAKAVEGLALEPGREFLLAESDRDFVEAALRLARSPGLRRHLCETAREFVLRRHGAEMIEAAVAAALREGETNR